MRPNTHWLWLGVLAFIAALALSHGQSPKAADPVSDGSADHSNETHVRLACEEYEMDRQYDPGLRRPAGCPVL